jgi:hypothetical protein
MIEKKEAGTLMLVPASCASSTRKNDLGNFYEDSRAQSITTYHQVLVMQHFEQ